MNSKFFKVLFFIGITFILYSYNDATVTTSILYNYYGLASVYNAYFYIGFSICLISTVCLFYNNENRFIVFTFLLLLLFIKVGTPQLTSSNLRIGDAWRNLGYTNNLISNGVNFQGSGYHNSWPNSYLLIAILHFFTGLDLMCIYKFLPIFIYLAIFFILFLFIQLFEMNKIQQFTSLLVLLSLDFLFEPGLYTPALVSYLVNILLLYLVFKYIYSKKVPQIFLLIMTLIVFESFNHPIHILFTLLIILFADAVFFIEILRSNKPYSHRKTINIITTGLVIYTCVYIYLNASQFSDIITSIYNYIDAAGDMSIYFSGRQISTAVPRFDPTSLRLIYNFYFIILAFIGIIISIRSKYEKSNILIGACSVLFLLFLIFASGGGLLRNIAYKPIIFAAPIIAVLVSFTIFHIKNVSINITKLSILSISFILMINIFSTYVLDGGQYGGTYFDQEAEALKYINFLNQKENTILIHDWRFKQLLEPLNIDSNLISENMSINDGSYIIYDKAYIKKETSYINMNLIYDNNLVFIFHNYNIPDSSIQDRTFM